MVVEGHPAGMQRSWDPDPDLWDPEVWALRPERLGEQPLVRPVPSQLGTMGRVLPLSGLGIRNP